MRHNFFDFAVGNKRAVHATDAAASGHKQHIALSKELLGSLLAQNRAAIDFRGYLERNTRWEIGLDGAGDDINRRALCCKHDMDTGRTRHLG